MLKQKLGKNMKEIRLGKNLSQQEAAQMCNISTEYWGRVERGEVSASINVIEKIADGLQVEVEMLLAEDGKVLSAEADVTSGGKSEG